MSRSPLPSRVKIVRSLGALTVAGALSVGSSSATHGRPGVPLATTVTLSAATASASQGCGNSNGQSALHCPLLFSLGPLNTLGLAANGLAPGDVRSRLLDVSNAQGGKLEKITLSVSTSSPAPPLTTDSAAGLQLAVDRCAPGWQPVNAGGYSCANTPTTVLAERAVLVSGALLNNLASLNQGGTDHLRLRLRFPGAATATGFTGNSATLTYTFVATSNVGNGQP